MLTNADNIASPTFPPRAQRGWRRICSICALAAGLALAGCDRQPAIFKRQLAPGDTVYFIPTAAKAVALTFDDGPNGQATESILDTLKSNAVPATFFLIGTNAVHYPRLARRIAEEGHCVGNHTRQHLRFDQIGVEQIAAEIAGGAADIAVAAGVTPRLFRPPYGINGTPAMTEICRTNNAAVVGWSLDASDWNRHTPREIADAIIDRTVGGDIILLHDGWDTHHDADRSATAEAVPIIVTALRKKGFRFVTVPELARLAERPPAEFGNGIRLLGLQLPQTPIAPGDDIQVRYFWSAPIGWEKNLPMAFVHFQSDNGHGRFQDDHALAPNGDVRDLPIKRMLTVPADTPPGLYRAHIGLFDPRNPDINARIPVKSAFPRRQNAVALPLTLEVRRAPSAKTP